MSTGSPGISSLVVFLQNRLRETGFQGSRGLQRCPLPAPALGYLEEGECVLSLVAPVFINQVQAFWKMPLGVAAA